MPLLLTWDSEFNHEHSEESMLATFLGLISVNVGIHLVTRFLQRTSKTKDILSVYVKEPPKNKDISRNITRMKYATDAVHIQNIRSMLTTCEKCVNYVLTSGNRLDLARASTLLKECGYEFNVSEGLSSHDTKKIKKAVTEMLGAAVSVVSMISGGGTVEGATCATVAIGLVGSGIVDVRNTVHPVSYGEVGIRTPNDVMIECKRWIALYNNLEKIGKKSFTLSSLEHRLVAKIVDTVGGTLRYTGMVLRSYVSGI